ncbi:MAG: YceI family protein [Bacteroidia bacterium]|nr:YceI family protein [Bacteroidia bacterium]NND10871.1 polyisoprenoid-binding protein [Flavobacteriaceae bacterium]MBT8310441.1 YceI family protein [Bacteroidia bacterium]NNK26604.1 polyisoprenoid-binding protein [Flavobacteriaceae bacterium]NNL61331.1 polyisoprenoid-binding protein [Flavobacteriaceae bacterium]
MKKRLCFLLITIFSASYISAQNFIIDSGHSSVQIQVERFGVVDVIGRFKDVQGNIQYNAEDSSKTSASSVIKVESYDANNTGGEEAVKSVAFLDAANYPEITFTGIETVKKEDKHYLKGNLTIHGVSNEIDLPFKVKGPKMDLATQKQSIAFSAWITINRQDYGVKFDRQLPDGTKLVGNDVKITLNILAIAE